ncbi:MAG: hypothetical protein HRF49_06800 [bacterium]|jgi:hypothetical protein
MDDRLVVDRNAVNFTLRGFLILIAGGFAILLLAQAISMLFAPPNLSRMSDNQLKKLSKKVKSALGSGAGVIASRYENGRSKMYAYPLSQEKPILLDVAYSMSGGTSFMSRYENAFDYLREDRHPVDILDHVKLLLQNIAGLFGRENSPNLALQMYPSVYSRFVIRLDDFNIASGEKFSLPPDPRGSTARAIVIPDPSGRNLFICRSDGPLFFDGKTGEKEVTIEMAPADQLGGYSAPAVTRRFKIKLPELNGSREPIRNIIRPLQGAKNGVYFVFYTVGGEKQVIVQSGIIFCSMLDDTGAKMVAHLVPEHVAQNGELVNTFVIATYVESTGTLLGVVENLWEDGYYRIMASFDPMSSMFKPLFKVGWDSTGGLIDYKLDEYFFFTSKKPEQASSFPFRKTSFRDENEAVIGMDSAGPDANYILCRLNLKSFTLKEIIATSANVRGFRTMGYGYSTPVFTLSETTREVIYADQHKLMSVDYEGGVPRTIADDGSGNWNMLWSIEANPDG